MCQSVSILDRIFETKREEVALAKSRVGLSELAEQGSHRPVMPFCQALRNSQHPVALIAEVKKASPSKGLIRPDFDPVQIAQTYASTAADCLSVLTDVSYFQGSPEYLEQIKDTVGIPCLRKDFIYDPYQIAQARAWGADAVLLIASALSRTQLSDLKGEIEALGMDALLEVHDEGESEVAIELGFGFVGVNNRNLKDFNTDLHISEGLLPMLRTGLPDAVLVSESAIETYADVARVAHAGANAVLIGTTFCAAPDIGSKVREVMGW